MKTIGISIVALLIIVGLIYLLLEKRKDESSFFISTSSQSNARVQNLSLDNPSEDMSHLLDIDALDFPKKKNSFEESEKKDYKAKPELEWIIKIIAPEDYTFKQSDLDNIFDYEWRRNYTSTLFGLASKDSRWTYVQAGDSLDSYTEIELAVNLLDTYNENVPNYDSKKLNRYLVELTEKFKDFEVPIQLAETESIEMAINKAKNLIGLNRKFGKNILIVLKADSKYNGLEFWDALTSLGLQWGDGDIFHWNNKYDFGDQVFFSVWTSTAPGYFFPEEVANGNCNPENLVFGYSIPRNSDPSAVFEIMLESVKYCQKRLGGVLLNYKGEPFNEIKEREEIQEIATKMKEEGIVPGSTMALRLY
jgi:cell division protein ZipA